MKIMFKVLLLLLLSATVLADELQSTILKYNHGKEIIDSIEEASSKYNVDKYIIASIIYVESKFNPRAYNRGCVGLMQINTRVWKLKNPYSIRENILKGTEIFASYYSKTKCLKKALVKYSGGSKRYAKKVLAYYNKLKGV